MNVDEQFLSHFVTNIYIYKVDTNKERSLVALSDNISSFPLVCCGLVGAF